MRRIVIVGAGHAGFQLAVELRQGGFDGGLVLIDEEAEFPYQRPPLSKNFLAPNAGEVIIQQRLPAFYPDNRIELVTGQKVVAINRARRIIGLSDHSDLVFDHLILATGARNRQLRVEGTDLSGIIYLRTAEETRALRMRFPACRNAVVIGAGFIGLEFAAVAAEAGVKVTVIEQAERVMARAVSPEISACFECLHRGWGTEFLLSSTVARIFGEDGAVSGVETANGKRIAADLVLVGIGVVPNTELAATAGLAVADGIVVNDVLATEDLSISAIGDCASQPNPYAAARIRVESVQNATDHARLLAKRLLQRPHRPFDAVPWFWSDQGPVKLQIAGLGLPSDNRVTRGDPRTDAFSVFRFREGRVAAVESIGRVGDHLAARQILGRRLALTPEQARDPTFDLKTLLRAAPAAVQ